MSRSPDVPSKLTLEDRQAIIDATILYCWAIDERDYEALDRVFVPDVHCEYRSIAPAFSGLAALKKILAAALDPLDLTQHMLTNHQIDMTEEGPRSRCYFHAQHVRASASGGPNLVVSGDY